MTLRGLRLLRRRSRPRDLPAVGPALLSPQYFPNTRRAKGPQLAVVELDEVPRRDARATPLAGKLSLSDDDVGLEADVGPARTRPDEAVLALDDAPHRSGVEDLALEPGVRGDGLDAVDGVGHRQRFVFEMGQQFHPEIDVVVFGVGHGEESARQRINPYHKRFLASRHSQE